MIVRTGINEERTIMESKRIAWAVTGAGHELEGCVNLLLKCKRADIFLSRAAEEVLVIYDLFKRLDAAGISIFRTTGASSPIIGKLFSGIYQAVVVAPATSNSVAKFVYGISDTLIANLFSQAGKAHIPVIVLPTDRSDVMDSLGPHNERIQVYPRAVDLENTAKLKSFSGVSVAGSLTELEQLLAGFASIADSA
jgi:flavoprotein